MSRPLTSLVHLAAGRPAQPEPGIVASAVEHRMGGLLLSAWHDGLIGLSGAEATDLIASDLTAETRHRTLWAVLEGAVSVLRQVEIDSVAIKGVVNEARWYRRIGERPCADVDLVLAPHCIDRVGEVLARLAPGYARTEEATALVRRRQLQHVHFAIDGVMVDLHLDPLKLGMWTRQAEKWWNPGSVIMSPGGVPITVLTPEMALVSAVTHLNKDRFAYLGAYAEVARIAGDPSLDWEWTARFVAGEGLGVPVWASLQHVASELSLDLPVPLAGGWRRAAWERLWPAASRLQGDEGRQDHRKRQMAIPFLAQGRSREALSEWRRCTLPPRALLDVHEEDGGLRHSYLRRITVDRLGR